MNPFARFRAWLSGGSSKGFMFIPRDGPPTGLPRTRYNYRRDIGKGLGSNVIMSPVMWVARNFTEAEPAVQRLSSNGRWAGARDHALATLLDEPNAFYDGDQLLKATVVSFELDGNAYWFKVRNELGAVVQLWYLPHHQIEPRWPAGGQAFITHYDLQATGQARVQIPVRDIVHIRNGLDPEDTRKGLSPLKTLLREIFTDEEASNFSATILRNMGVPGGVISPATDTKMSAVAVDEMQEYVEKGFRGDRRGGWLAFSSPTKIEQFGFDPNQLMLTNLRDIAEERVCAAVGIPAAVVGFGAGLQQTKVGATMKELRRLAWVSKIIPMQTSMARQVRRQLMPDFQSQYRRFRVHFDTSGVSAFVEEERERADRIAKVVATGILRVDRAQEALGLEVDPEQAVYLRPAGVREVRDGVVATANDPGGD
ncbi:phage portal protein [Candidatus Palauibacter sp.]|uniref:phage portal protein n=1 Tax=Candidatus Palauibacter sp. TaxID=3101350 RepID=UPI003CC66319